MIKKFGSSLKNKGLSSALLKISQYLLFLIKTRWYAIKGEYVQIEREDIKVISHKGKIKIYWKSLELTGGSGFSTWLYVLDQGYDSAEYSWSLKKIDNTKLVIKNRWKALPLTLFWEVVLLDDQEINLTVKIELEEDLNIDVRKAILAVSGKYNKWQAPFKESGLVSSDDYLPDMLFIFNGKNIEPALKYNIDILDNLNSKVLEVGITESSGKQEYLPGIYEYFSLDIFLFDKDPEGQKRLNAKCEKMLSKPKDRMVSAEEGILAKNGQRLTQKKYTYEFKVVLANLPWQRNGKWGVRAGSRWPHIKNEAEGGYLPFPFYLAYAAALLEKNGFKVKLIDALAEELSDAAFLNSLNKWGPDLLLAETSTGSLNDDLSLLEKVNRNIPIALCGPDINIRNPLFLKNNNFIKYVLTGEYEFTLLDLVNHLRAGKDSKDVGGLIYKDNLGSINVGSPRPLIKNLDEFPWPLRRQLPLEKYLDAPGEIPFPTAQMWASRGCPFHCIFCLWPQIMYGGNQYRVRNIMDVVDEMQYLVKEMGFKSIYFDDDTFNVGKSRMLDFCQELKKRKLHIPWAIMARVDLMDEEILTRMKEAGLCAVKYGVESGVQELLDNANKNMDLEKAKQMIRFTKQLGIKTHLTFTFGLPGETKETIQRTVDSVFELDPDSAQFSITTYYPGTEYFEYLDKKGLIATKDWSHYDGNFKSIIKSESLTAEDLENAKREAVEKWLEHTRLKRGFKDNLGVFKRYLAKEGIKFTIKKSLSYFKKRCLQHKPSYLLKNWEKASNTARKIIKYIAAGRAQRDYLDILGIFDGSYAYKGPNFVQIDLTNNCNNDCIGCWCNSPLLEDKKQNAETKKQTIPYRRAKELIDEFCKLGTKEIYLAGGGEPFMHPEIMHIVEYIKRKKLICDINTNFTLVDVEKIDKIIQLKVDALVVSVWAASAETYVATHPNKDRDTFYKIKERLKILNSNKAGLPHVHIYNVITNLNFQEIEKMVDFALEVKADSAGFTVLDTIPDRTDVLLLNDEQRKEVLRQCEIIKKRKDLGKLKVLEFERFIQRVAASQARIAQYDKEIIESMPCYIGWLFSRVMADGNVNACLKAHRIPVGNIHQQDFSEIWNGSLQREFRKKTLACKKDDPYFSLIGNDPDVKTGCYKSCDDLSRNIYMHRRISMLSATEKFNLRLIKNLKRIHRKIKSAKTNNVYDIILVMPPPWATKMPPLGIAYLAAYLKEKGFSPYVYDLNLKLCNKAKWKNKLFWQIENLNNKSPEDAAKEVVARFKHDFSAFADELLFIESRVIGFSVSLINLWVALEIAKMIKAKDPGRIIIFGGPGCFWDYQRIAPGLVDAFVIGEGEEALSNILKAIKDGQDIKDIPGVVTSEGSRYRQLIPQKLLDINTIPFPRFSEFQLKEYNKGSGYKPLPILTSRGCIGRCNYCIDCQMWGNLRQRPAENVFKEIEFHYKNYGIWEFEFNDLICNGNLKELERFADLVIASGYKINWVSYAIIRKDMDYGLFLKLKKGGCHTLIYGVESGADTILKKMNKYYTAEDAEKIIRFTHQAGICANINIIVGFPGETESEFNETAEFLRRNREYIDEVTNVSGCVLFLGSAMGLAQEKFGILLPEQADPLLYRDKAGLTPEIKKERVKKMLAIISAAGIKCQIINNPTERRIRVSKLNAELACSLKG